MKQFDKQMQIKCYLLLYLNVCPAPYLFCMNNDIKHITPSTIYTFHRHFIENEQIGVTIQSFGANISGAIQVMDVKFV